MGETKQGRVGRFRIGWFEYFQLGIWDTGALSSCLVPGQGMIRAEECKHQTEEGGPEYRLWIRLFYR